MEAESQEAETQIDRTAAKAGSIFQLNFIELPSSNNAATNSHVRSDRAAGRVKASRLLGSFAGRAEIHAGELVVEEFTKYTFCVVDIAGCAKPYEGHDLAGFSVDHGDEEYGNVGGTADEKCQARPPVRTWPVPWTKTRRSEFAEQGRLATWSPSV